MPEAGEASADSLRRMLGVFGMAVGAGAVSFGHNNIIQRYAAPSPKISQLALIIVANDVSPREKERFLQRLKPQVPVLCQFNSEQLSQAAGRPSVVFAACKQHGLINVLRERAQGLSFLAEWCQTVTAT